ncbi:MAG TPA: glycosyltransferase family 4 protein [Candidatus Acidoferrum sp.]|nr:glycosyltransferase family 4 protein [Candidatus Acidoferrum sp.]
MASKYRFRVALISYNYGEYCVRLASALAERADVLLVVPDGLIEPHLAKLNSSVQLFSFSHPRLRQPMRQFLVIRKIFRRIREFAPNVIHYQGAHLWFDLALPFLRRYPLVFTIHDFKSHPGDRLSQKTPLWVEMFARRRTDELIVHSQFLRNEVAQHLPGAAAKTSVIPHIQIGEELPFSASKEEEHLALFFGRIWEYKGLEYLIRAEPLITARVPDARILIAGQGEDFSRYARMMVHPDRFIVHNQFISEKRAVDYFHRASVVVLPYIEASQSGVIPMAYSAGKPVVATAVGGLPEIVEDGSTGLLVAPHDAAQLADAVTRLLLDAPLRRQMGQNGKSKLEAECSPDVVARKTMEVYQRAVARSCPSLKENRINNSLTSSPSVEVRK